MVGCKPERNAPEDARRPWLKIKGHSGFENQLSRSALRKFPLFNSHPLTLTYIPPMLVRERLVMAAGGFSDLRQLQASKRPDEQKKWLVEKFPLYVGHHARKSLRQFFPSLHREFFDKWPPTPDERDLEVAGGDIAVATAAARKREETVRAFDKH